MQIEMLSFVRTNRCASPAPSKSNDSSVHSIFAVRDSGKSAHVKKVCCTNEVGGRVSAT
jgi:hypothetical protein